MYLEELHLYTFRNITEQSISLIRGFNYLYGENGAGKTAVLEAVHLLARGRSFRTHKVQPLVQDGYDQFVLRAKVSSDLSTSHQLAMSKSLSGDTQLRLDHESIARASVFAQLLPVQVLLPDAGDLVVKAPGLRRGYLDWGLFHVEQSFLECSKQFRRALAQRNAWLKLPEAEGSGLAGDPWFNQYAELAVELSLLRERYIAELAVHFRSALASLAPELSLDLQYDWGGLQDATMAHKKMSESWARDVKFGQTHRGPQRGDLIFKMSDQIAAEVVSRGQSKLIASAAILAQAKMLYQQRKVKSVFLIDDFGAELDAGHWQFFLDTLLDLDCQVIATSTEPPDKNRNWAAGVGDMSVFHVEHGEIVTHVLGNDQNRAADIGVQSPN